MWETTRDESKQICGGGTGRRRRYKTTKQINTCMQQESVTLGSRPATWVVWWKLRPRRKAAVVTAVADFFLRVVAQESERQTFFSMHPALLYRQGLPSLEITTFQLNFESSPVSGWGTLQVVAFSSRFEAEVKVTEKNHAKNHYSVKYWIFFLFSKKNEDRIK